MDTQWDVLGATPYAPAWGMQAATPESAAKGSASCLDSVKIHGLSESDFVEVVYPKVPSHFQLEMCPMFNLPERKSGVQPVMNRPRASLVHWRGRPSR